MGELIKKGELMKETDPKIDLCPSPRHKLQTLSAEDRHGNFEEVDLPMTQTEAITEANRCMRCYRIYGVVTQLPIPGNVTHIQNQAV